MRSFAASKALPQCVRYLSLAVITLITILVCFCSNLIIYSFYLDALRENGALLLMLAVASLVIYGALLMVIRACGLMAFLDDTKRFRYFVIIATILLLCLQAWLITASSFVAGNDSAAVTNIAEQRANSVYFSRSPHNLFIAGVYTLIDRIFGITGADTYFWMKFGGCLSTTLALALAAHITRKIGGTTAAVAVLLAGCVWLGCSPVAQTPYTDSYGILWPTLALYFYSCVKNPYIQWPGIICASVVGYSMKPAALAMFGAIIFIEACRICAARHSARKAVASQEAAPQTSPSQTPKAPAAPSRTRNTLVIVLSCVISFGLAAGACEAIRQIPDVALNKEMTMGIPHYLLVGISRERGVYSDEVVEFSTSFETSEERTRASMEYWAQRLQTIGPDGLVSLALSKTLTTFGDGSFFWGGDRPDVVETQNPLLIWLYGLTPFTDDMPNPLIVSRWSSFAHIIWEGILIGCVLGWLRGRRVSRPELVIYATILLFYGYILVFEANPRYSFMFAPEFLILAPLGCKSLIQRLRNLWQKRAQNNAST